MAIDIDGADAAQTLDGLALRTRDLELSALSFSRAMTGAFASSVTGARQFDDVLKSLALRLSDLAVRLAFKPLEKSIAGGIGSLLSGLTGVGGAAGVTLAAASGVAIWIVTWVAPPWAATPRRPSGPRASGMIASGPASPARPTPPGDSGK